MPAQFQVFQDSKDEFRWRLLAENNKTIAVASEGYTAKTDASNAVDLVRSGRGSYETYLDSKKEWRGRFVATNKQIIATGGEGYKDLGDCEHGIKLTQSMAPTAKVVDQTL
ncbi:MAG: YegP family protein [bacterium]